MSVMYLFIVRRKRLAPAAALLSLLRLLSLLLLGGGTDACLPRSFLSCHRAAGARVLTRPACNAAVVCPGARCAGGAAHRLLPGACGRHLQVRRVGPQNRGPSLSAQHSTAQLLFECHALPG